MSCKMYDHENFVHYEAKNLLGLYRLLYITVVTTTPKNNVLFLKQSWIISLFFFLSMHLYLLTSMSILFISWSPPLQRTVFGSILNWMVPGPTAGISSWDRTSPLNTWFHCLLDHISFYLLVLAFISLVISLVKVFWR